MDTDDKIKSYIIKKISFVRRHFPNLTHFCFFFFSVKRTREREMLASECSSGCESGWTLYFEHSMNPSRTKRPFLDEGVAPSFQKNAYYRKNQAEEKEEDEEVEKDMSMVSDASSGPPNFNDDTEEGEHATYFNNGVCNNLYPKTDHQGRHSTSVKCTTSGESNKSPRHQHEQPASLDDTASSPMINFTPNASPHIQNLSSLSPTEHANWLH